MNVNKINVKLTPKFPSDFPSNEMGLPKEIYTRGLLHKHEQIFRCSLKRNKKEEADEEFLVYVRSNVCMLQKEKVCY